MDTAKVFGAIQGARDAMVDTLADLCRIPAIGPAAGGEGEGKKADRLQEILRALGLKVERMDAPDDRVPSGKRPNVIVKVGKGAGRLWLLSHIDIVPPGDRAGWRVDPFDPKVLDGRLYGRGVEDNGQAATSRAHPPAPSASPSSRTRRRGARRASGTSSRRGSSGRRT